MTLRTVHLLADLTPPERWYREHVGNALTCGCNINGPDKDCMVGQALWRVQNQKNYEVRKRSWALKHGLVSPWD